MGWNDGPPTWSEMERVLSSRPARPRPEIVGDGGDSPAWSRKRGAYEGSVTSSGPSEIAYAELHAHSAFSFLDGASHPCEKAVEHLHQG